MPELPEVEALAAFLREHAVGHAIARADVAAISVLKTYDPPLSALAGLLVSGVSRHGKFLDILVGGPAGSGPAGSGADHQAGEGRAAPLHLVTHLARAGWLRWSDNLPIAPPRPGKGPLALRVLLDDGSGFDLTEAGTQKRLAV
jgi:formamidopyrimidine-DNA glycosylase